MNYSFCVNKPQSVIVYSFGRVKYPFNSPCTLYNIHFLYLSQNISMAWFSCYNQYINAASVLRQCKHKTMRHNRVSQTKSISEFEILSYIRYAFIYSISLPMASKANIIREYFTAHARYFVTYF